MNANPPSDPVYLYKPNLVGAPWVFCLKADGIAWEFGRRSGLVPYEEVRRVRLAFRPATLQTQRFMAEIWSQHGPKLQISSTTFRSLMEQARQDAEYTEFVTELHRRLAERGSSARFEAGMHPVLYWAGVAVFVVIGLALGGFLVRTLFSGDLAGTAVLAGLLGLFGWQVGMVFRRNRPLVYDPLAPPALVLPR